MAACCPVSTPLPITDSRGERAVWITCSATTLVTAAGNLHFDVPGFLFGIRLCSLILTQREMALDVMAESASNACVGLTSPIPPVACWASGAAVNGVVPVDAWLYASCCHPGRVGATAGSCQQGRGAPSKVACRSGCRDRLRPRSVGAFMQASPIPRQPRVRAPHPPASTAAGRQRRRRRWSAGLVGGRRRTAS